MRIGIITITGEANYGNSLQNYAVEWVLNKLNCSSSTIKTNYEPNYYSFSFSNIKRIIKQVIHYSDYLFYIRRKRFVRFNNKFLHKTKKIYDRDNLDIEDFSSFDALLFGSDQIWNFTIVQKEKSYDLVKYYSGGFQPNIRKVAYSASIGTNYIPDYCIKDFKNNLSNFDAISVRENVAQNVLSSIVENDVRVTIDPTLMLDKSDWIGISKKPKWIDIKDKYILTYFLGYLSDEQKSFINRIANRYSLKIISLNSEYLECDKIINNDYFVVDPSEFIWLIDNSEIVLTDSFHGTVFSILFDKAFRCFKRNDDGVSDMFCRMNSLFEMFEIGDWCIGNEMENIENIFYKDYSNVENILQEKRKYAYDYLKGAIGINET